MTTQETHTPLTSAGGSISSSTSINHSVSCTASTTSDPGSISSSSSSISSEPSSGSSTSLSTYSLQQESQDVSPDGTPLVLSSSLAICNNNRVLGEHNLESTLGMSLLVHPGTAMPAEQKVSGKYSQSLPTKVEPSLID